jgi:phage shock protein A
MLAVQQNQDELAKQALIRRTEHLQRGDQLNLTWQAHKEETDRLKNSLRSLNDNIEEANRKKNLLLAKQRRADAQRRINETMSHISEKSAFEAFARMEEKIDANERKVRASAEIDEEFSGDKLANDFKKLEAGGANISAEMQLIQLKQKMGVLSAGTQINNKALGAGNRAEEESVEVEEIHDENK